MSIEQQILFQHLLVPALLGALGGWILISAKEGDDWEPPLFLQHFPKLFLGTFLCGLAIILSDFWRRGILTNPADWLTWKAGYRWEWMVFLVPFAFVLFGVLRSCVSAPSSFAKLIWPIIVVLAVGLLYLSLYELEVWSKQLTYLFQATVVGSIAIAVNVAAIDSLASSGASRWGLLVAIGQMGCVATIAIQSYLSLGQWMVSCIGVTVGLAFCAAWTPHRTETFCGWQLSLVAVPLLCATVPTFFLSQLFSSERIPLWIAGSILFLPAIVWCFDAVYTRTCNSWVRILWAFLLCVTLLIVILVVTNPFESEW